MFYRAADCIFFCFDLTQLASLTALADWHEEVVNAISETERIIMVLVGTKSDLPEERQVS